MHKSTGGHSTDDSYVRTDEEDAELYDHDPKVRNFLHTSHLSLHAHSLSECIISMYITLSNAIGLPNLFLRVIPVKK